ncbi:MAG: TlpA family protein disulfide reductase, partial [Bacteroidia bacterium]|nr:TlpA family protein disulfide reductase [Bacteroidia bacterium]
KTKQVTWLSEEQMKKIIERADKLSYTLLGKKPVPLRLNTLENKPVAFYDIKAKYTQLYFWDPDCGPCKKVTPKILDIYHKYKNKGFEVYAVCIDQKIEPMKKYIEENKLDWINVSDPTHQSNFRYFYDIYSTPVLYLLNENKEIVMKRITDEQLDEYLKEKLK